jgi:hypothetical protein
MNAGELAASAVGVESRDVSGCNGSGTAPAPAVG